MQVKLREIECKSAISKCGFPGGGWAINPYIGCEHNCSYCYARFIKRFTGHKESWGNFVDARTNVDSVLEKQMVSGKYDNQQVFIGTVTDPYQPAEKKYTITKKILQVLLEHNSRVSILTKSDLVLRDIGLIKKFRNVDVNFTINTLDEKWKRLVEPGSPSVRRRLSAARKLSKNRIKVFAMMGPYWPFFTDPDKLFGEFRKAGIVHVYTESFNTTGGNWTGVEKVLEKFYPEILPDMKKIMFNKSEFENFYSGEAEKIKTSSKKFGLPVTIYFGAGHAAKFK